MSGFREYDFTKEAVGYVVDCLKRGGTLSKLVLDNLDISLGQVLTYLPEDVEPEYATRFPYGFWMDGREPRRWIMRSIVELVNDRNEAVLVGERNARLPSRGGQLPPVAKRVLFENDLYVSLTGSGLSLEGVEWFARLANAYPVVRVFLTGCLGEPDFAGVSDELTINDLKVWAQRTEGIILGAYDGEGYLLWKKP